MAVNIVEDYENSIKITCYNMPFTPQYWAMLSPRASAPCVTMMVKTPEALLRYGLVVMRSGGKIR
jgi:hypothetical protein